MYGALAALLVLAVPILAPQVTKRLIARQTQQWAAGQREKAGIGMGDQAGK